MQRLPQRSMGAKFLPISAKVSFGTGGGGGLVPTPPPDTPESKTPPPLLPTTPGPDRSLPLTVPTLTENEKADTTSYVAYLEHRIAEWEQYHHRKDEEDRVHDLECKLRDLEVSGQRRAALGVQHAS